MVTARNTSLCDQHFLEQAVEEKNALEMLLLFLVSRRSEAAPLTTSENFNGRLSYYLIHDL